MKKNIIALLLCGMLCVSGGMPVVAAEQPIENSGISEHAAELPDSVLYYGRVKKVIKGDDGEITQIWLESERYGEYMMNVSEETCWIDDGQRKAERYHDVQVGEGLYIFHSPVQTMSLPPQSAAFAIVRNTPMDVGCAQYHEVEAVSQENGEVRIQTDDGELVILAGSDTVFSAYDSQQKVSAEDLQPGDHFMAWYGAKMTSQPAQASATHIMLLPASSREPLSRAELAQMLYEQAGKPYVDFPVQYCDVDWRESYADAAAWAGRQKLIVDSEDGCLEPEKAVTKEELIQALWRLEGSPMLMDYTGLSELEDVKEISRSAQQAMAWAHEQGLMTGSKAYPQNGYDWGSGATSAASGGKGLIRK